MIKLLSDFIPNYYLRRGELNGISVFSRETFYIFEFTDSIEFNTSVLTSSRSSLSFSIQFSDSRNINIYLLQGDSLSLSDVILSVDLNTIYEVSISDLFNINDFYVYPVNTSLSLSLLLLDSNKVFNLFNFYESLSISETENQLINLSLFDELVYLDIVSTYLPVYIFEWFGFVDSLYYKPIYLLQDAFIDPFSQSISVLDIYILIDNILFYDNYISDIESNISFYLQLNEFIDVIGNYVEEMSRYSADSLLLYSLIYPYVITGVSDYITLETLQSGIKIYSYSSNILLSDYTNIDINEFLISPFPDYQTAMRSLSEVTIEDHILINDFINLLRNIVINLSDALAFRTLVSLLSLILEDIKSFYIYFDFYQPLRFSILELSALFGGDTVFCAYDGIYSLDYSTSQKSMLSINLSELQSSRMKRLDKIYSNVPLTKATIYADSKKYNLSGNSVFIPIPKGIRAKDYRVVIYNSDDIEFVDIGIVEERRPK